MANVPNEDCPKNVDNSFPFCDKRCVWSSFIPPKLSSLNVSQAVGCPVKQL